MNKNSFILAIFLVFVVIVSSSVAFAEDSATVNDNLKLDESSEASNIIQSTEDTKLSTSYDINKSADSATIQKTINSMSDGDTLNFEDGTYKDICIYVDKSITINGNGAQLIGYENPNENTTPNKITNPTSEGGYGIGNYATLYVVNTTNVVINGLTIVGQNQAYGQAAVFANSVDNLTIENSGINGGYWGIYLEYCADGTITNNTVQNQEAIGIINFGSPRTVISENTVINAKNHGIDARHGTGPDVQVIGNTVIGSKEGIYLMHSRGHTVSGNEIINCTESSITCYGSGQIVISGNTMKKSRIGILLGGGYYDIEVKENTYQLDSLPFPPTFVYYVAQAKSEYQSAADVIGTYSDSTSNNVTYTAGADIATPVAINPDYSAILNPTGTTYTVNNTMTGADIQKMIDSMADGDTLSFESNAVFNDISIYTDKNIKILGNNATLVGYSNINASNIPEKVRKATSEGGYAIGEYAVLYIVNTTSAVVSDLNIVGQFPSYTQANTNTEEYKTVGLHVESSKNVTAVNLDITGASWGIFLRSSPDGLVANNNIHDVYTTGIMNFGSARNTIMSNTITNAVNHGIDVRHGTGPNVVIYNNTVNGAKEGIYLMHSQGHKVYNNTVNNYKISAFTAYGSGNEAIFNNTIGAGRLYFLLSGGYYNVTIGTNKYPASSMYYPFPPTFREFIAQADSKFQSADDVIGLYSTNTTTILTAEDVNTTTAENTIEVTLKDGNGNAIANEEVNLSLNGANYTSFTDAKGIASFDVSVANGLNTANFIYNARSNFESSTATAVINATISSVPSALTITTVNNKNSISGVLSDANGKVIPNAVITYSNNGVEAKITTDANGEFTINNVTSGTVYINYAGSEANDPVNITILKDGVAPVVRTETLFESEVYNTYAIDWNGGERGNYFVFYLKDKDGNPLANKNVTIGFNGVTYNRTTDENGIAKLQINLANAGTYTFAMGFLGDDGYLGAFAVQKIVVTKKKTSISAAAKSYKASATKKYTVTLKTIVGNSSTGKAIMKQGKTVKLTINGKTYKAKTNSAGKATFTLKLTKKGTYTAKIKFAGDNTYKASSKSVKITIK